MKAWLQGFVARTEGSIAVVAGIVIVVLGVATGVAVDYARAAQTRSAVAQALDAATLSAARELSSGRITAAQVEGRARAYFDANIAGNRLGDVVIDSFATVVDAETGAVRATAEAKLPTTFMNIAGVSEISAGASSEVHYELTDIEMALVLDVTGSMAGLNKIQDLRAASRDLVDILIPGDGEGNGGSRVRIGLVPFSCAVNVGRYAANVTGEAPPLTMPATMSWSDSNCGSATGVGRINADGLNPCVTERSGSTVFTDAGSATSPFPTASEWCPAQAVMPLTSDRDALRNTLGALQAQGRTAGHIGTAWGWYLLSPRWNALWPNVSDAAEYGDNDVVKVLVLMTDGAFNQSYSGIGSGSQAESICANAKLEGIIIYTVSFFIPGDPQVRNPSEQATAESVMRECASAPNMAFTPANGAELRASFASIAGSVRQMWLSR